MKFLRLNYHDDFNLLSNGSEKKCIYVYGERSRTQQNDEM